MSEIKPHSCSAEAIAQEIADNTPHGKKTDTYARIYQGAYFGAVRAFEESSASLNRASDACASVQRERDDLREALREQIGECFDDRCEMCMRHEAILARYEGGR